MIEEKKIEEAAKKHMLEQFYSKDKAEYPIECGEIDRQCQNDFKEGINWFLDNLWHDAKEKPKVPNGDICVTCLVKFKNASTELCTYWSTGGWICDDMCPKDFRRNFAGWLYVDDLLKGGK